ncbi:MAG TPA: ABC transporter permease [Acidimicrobiia bacterium]
MPEGVVFDLGYRPHEGPRLGRSGARWALYRDGLRRVLGLRRRARRKVFPIVLMSIAVMPALFFVAFSVVAGEFDTDAELFGHAMYFELTGVMALIFVALAAGELLVPDRVNGTLAVYASRPLTTTDYLVARTASLGTVVVGFLWLPHVVLFVGRACVDGFGSYVADNWPTLWQTLLASVVYFAAYAPLALLIATVSKRGGIAAVLFLGILLISGGATAALVDSGFRTLGLLALNQHPGYVKDWILDANSHDWIPQLAGYDAIVSLVVILTLAALFGLLIVIRQQKAS